MKGTYNCPICGWNQPHSEHAGEQIARLLEENHRLRSVVAALHDVKREMKVHLKAGSFVLARGSLQSWIARLDIQLYGVRDVQRGPDHP